jgi:hypothetical protein
MLWTQGMLPCMTCPSCSGEMPSPEVIMHAYACSETQHGQGELAWDAHPVGLEPSCIRSAQELARYGGKRASLRG